MRVRARSPRPSECFSRQRIRPKNFPQYESISFARYASRQLVRPIGRCTFQLRCTFALPPHLPLKVSADGTTRREADYARSAGG